MDMSYEKWIWHGETPPSIGSSCKRVRIEKVCDENNDHLIDMFNEFTKTLEKTNKPIYLSSNITKFSFLVRM